MLHRILALASLCALAASLAPVGAAAEPAAPVLARIVEKGTLRVGMTGDQPPLNMKNKSGEVIGLEADLAALLAGSMQVELQLVVKPFSELLGALEKGEVDAVMSGVTITPERNLRVAFVGPYFVSGKSILTRSEKLAAATDAAALDKPEVKVAALKGSTSQRFVEMLLPKATLTTVENYDAGVKLVIGAKVDALVADYPICVLSVLRHPEAGLSTLLSPLTIEPIGIALPPGDALYINLVQNYLGALQSTGVLATLRHRWLEDGAWLAELP